MRSAIERAVPHGRTANGGPGDRGAWRNPPHAVSSSWSSLKARFDRIVEKHPKIAKSNNENHLGTLGTGNHFIEVCLDEAQNVWVMLHSGSRGVGSRIGSYFIELAREDMRRWFVNLPDMDLAYLPEGTENFDDYVVAVGWAQDYALANRALMLDAAVSALAGTLDKRVSFAETAVQCHHNYVSREHHFGENVIVTRKGAVRARDGELGIIPGSMGTRSYIVRGKGNPMSFESCSHGAGRRMSRGEAKRTFSLEDHAKAVEGVECRRDADVIDETPGAYKPIDAVMEAQKDLVDDVHELKQVLCVKG
jgi:tRNA-splicing ligase RtcB